MKINISATILDLIRNITQNGGRAVLVGGCVRDGLLGLPVKDWDIEIFSTSPPQLETLLEAWGPVLTIGKSFGIYRLPRLNLDVALPRHDWPTGDGGHKGFSITVDPSLSFEKAVQRRDLTINSIGFDPLTDTLLDPAQGIADLENKVLRATDPLRFQEDPLRGLRVMQLAARFCMTPDPQLINICRTLPIETLSPERIYGEFDKLLLKGKKPSLGLDFLKETNLVRFFPALSTLAENSSWTSTLLSLDQGAMMRSGHHQEDRTLMFSLLCHCLPPDAGKEFLTRLRANHRLIRAVMAMVQHQEKPVAYLLENAPRGHYQCLARDLVKNHSTPLRLLWGMAAAIEQGQESVNEETLARLYDKIPDLKTWEIWEKAPQDIVTGHFLKKHGFTPGPMFSRVLKACQQVQDATLLTDPEVILAQVQDLGSTP